MNKLREMLDPDSEYNKNILKNAVKMAYESYLEKACCTCKYFIPPDPTIPEYFGDYGECSFIGNTNKSCDKYEVRIDLLKEFKMFKNELEKLKPCPFCGEKPYFESKDLYKADLIEGNHNYRYEVKIKLQCNTCKVEKSSYSRYQLEDNGRLTCLKDGCTELTAWWNSRAEENINE